MRVYAEKKIVLISEQNEDNDAFSCTFMFLSYADPLLRSVGVCKIFTLAKAFNAAVDLS